jgi:hypothetical protein
MSYPPVTSYPADVLEAIAAAVFAAALPSTVTSLDPLYLLNPSDGVPPTDSPSTYPAAYWPEPVSRKTLAALCLVSKDFREAARPWLWHRLEINVPRNWLGILDTICGQDEEPENPPNSITSVLTHGFVEDGRSRATARAPAPVCERIYESISSGSSTVTEAVSDADAVAALPSGMGSVPHDLLTPPSSRDPSPARLRLRAASPGRWRFIKAVNKVVHHSGLYGTHFFATNLL